MIEKVAPDRRVGADPRRERHRQGAHRARAAFAERAQGRAIRRDQLRRHSREAARERAVRLREGRVHRRGEADARQDRDGERRHAVPRRDRRHAAARCRPNYCASCRTASSSASAAAQEIPVDVRVVCATNKDLQAADRRAEVPRGPVLPHQRSDDQGAAAARAARRADRARARAAAQVQRRAGPAEARLHRRGDRGARGLSAGPATCASSRTR